MKPTPIMVAIWYQFGVEHHNAHDVHWGIYAASGGPCLHFGKWR